MVIAIDFDGTCVKHAYPEIGADIGAVPVLKELVANGHDLMLWTMRGNKPDPGTLKDAVQWFNDNGIILWGVNENSEQTLIGWTNSNKQYAQLYIDDAALGAPLLRDSKYDRPYYDWVTARVILMKAGLIRPTDADIDAMVRNTLSV